MAHHSSSLNHDDKISDHETSRRAIYLSSQTLKLKKLSVLTVSLITKFTLKTKKILRLK